MMVYPTAVSMNANGSIALFVSYNTSRTPFLPLTFVFCTCVYYNCYFNRSNRNAHVVRQVTLLTGTVTTLSGQALRRV